MTDEFRDQAIWDHLARSIKKLFDECFPNEQVAIAVLYQRRVRNRLEFTSNVDSESTKSMLQAAIERLEAGAVAQQELDTDVVERTQ